MNKNQIIIQALHSPGELAEVRNFLHRIYVMEMGWRPREKNPSNQQIKIMKGLPVLQDRYDESAQWFGAYLSGRIIGCCRICTRQDGLFEVEHYQKLPDMILQQNPLYEFNRFAVAKGHATDMIFCGFMETIFHLALRQDFIFFSTTGMKNREMFEKIGMQVFDQVSFRYSPTDPNTVNFTYFMDNEKQDILNICNRIFKSAEEKR
jgi:hypothetical protein